MRLQKIPCVVYNKSRRIGGHIRVMLPFSKVCLHYVDGALIFMIFVWSQVFGRDPVGKGFADRIPEFRVLQ